jgi:Uma2 family endonuclease
VSTTTTLLTVQEFLALPESEGERIELFGGEVVRMGRGGIPHELVKSNLILLLAIWAKQSRRLS